MENLVPVPNEKHSLRFRDQPEGEVVDVKLYYRRGSNRHSRGLYLQVHTVTVADGWESCPLFQGFRTRVVPMERVSGTLLNRVAQRADPYVRGLAKAFRAEGDAARPVFDQLVASLSAP